MKKVQCTFRLPENVVNLIDQQPGETRTEKLLSLISAEEVKVTDEGVMQNVIKNALHPIEERLKALESKTLKSNPSANSANQQRKNRTIASIKSELETLTQEQINAIKNARYPLSEVRKSTKITKSQCDSYSDMIRDFLNMSNE